MWAQGVACGIGLWLMASPQVLGYGGAARINDLAVGPIAASIACVALWQVTRSVRWANLGVAAWLVLSPLVLGHVPAAAANSILSGLALGGLSCVRGRLTHRMGGGWAELFRKEVRRPLP
jgi:hypothetical protein